MQKITTKINKWILRHLFNKGDKLTKAIAVDFDDTIATYHGWEKGAINGVPVDGVKEAFIEFKKLGYRIIVYTCRTSPENFEVPKEAKEQMNLLVGWFKQYDIPYDEICDYGKPIADFYIDDRAIRFNRNWTETVQFVKDNPAKKEHIKH